MKTRLGVNIDHVATLREVRKAVYPDLLAAAKCAIEAGADGITVHLREDRRHIQDEDVQRLLKVITVPMNLEISLAEKMVDLALYYKPQHVCLVPERRAELTTEGGLDVLANKDRLEDAVPRLKSAGIQVSLFIDPDKQQIAAASAVGADVIELHTGKYADPDFTHLELDKIITMAAYADSLGLEVHAGHGLTLDNLAPLVAIDQIREFNIGHAIVAHSIFTGLAEAVRAYKQCIAQAE